MNHDDSIIFLGAPLFAAEHLRALLNAGENVVGVITRPDKPRGRGRQLSPTPVKEVALENKIEVIAPENPRDPETIGWVKNKNPWLMVTVAYGRILPPEMLKIPRLGAWNVHASILPRWRGAAPIIRAVQHGDPKTGVTLMLMNEGLDAGDMLLTEETEIGEEETGGEIEARLMKIGASVLLRGIEAARRGMLTPNRQPEQGITLAPPIRKEEANIVWSKPAREIHDLIRAFNPRPTARSGELKILKSKVCGGAPATGAAGSVKEIVPDGVVVNAGNGLLLVSEVQPPGKRAMSAADYARGRKLSSGDMI